MEEKKMENTKIICQLCGKEIQPIKGKPQRAFEEEKQRRSHNECHAKVSMITESKHLTFPDNIIAFMQSVQMVLPSITEQAPLKAYEARRLDAEKEIEMAFPHYHEMRTKEREAQAMMAAQMQAARAAQEGDRPPLKASISAMGSKSPKREPSEPGKDAATVPQQPAEQLK